MLNAPYSKTKPTIWCARTSSELANTTGFSKLPLKALLTITADSKISSRLSAGITTPLETSNSLWPLLPTLCISLMACLGEPY